MKLRAPAVARITALATFAAAAASAALATSAACETRATGSFFAERLRPSVTERYPGASITCPERILIKLETVFACDIDLTDGSSTSILVTFDRESMLSWRTQ